MLFLKEEKLAERGTEFSNITPKEAWNKLVAWIKKGNEFQAHLGFFDGSLTSMEGRYTKVKFGGSYIVFTDAKNSSNRFHLYAKDIVGAEFGEDAAVDFQSLRVDLRSKAFISITPWK